MDKVFKNLEDFVSYIHQLSVRDLILEMGYVQEDDFRGSKIKCTFHGSDNTPSLQITENFFKCYGCSAKGDILKWIELSDSLTFIESVNKLATHLNATIENTNLTEFNKKQKELNQAWDYYKSELGKVLESHPHKEVIRKEISTFFPLQVGWDPKIRYLVFTFTGKTNQVLGFTKRRMDFPGEDRKDHQKWDHSTTKDSLISNCSNIFNLGNAYKEIKKNQSAIFVEGPRDVAAVLRSGRLNTVAISGTSNFSDKVLEVIKPLKNLIMFMDGDSAGKKANVVNILTLIKIDPLLVLNTKIVVPPDEEDPASISEEVLNECFRDSYDALNWFVLHASEEEIKKLYSDCDSEIVRPYIIAQIKREMCFNYNQTIEWLSNNNPIKTKNNNDDYIQKLLSTIGKCDDIKIEPLNISEEEAKKILKLRYNIVIE